MAGAAGAAGPGYNSVVLTMGNETDNPVGRSVFIFINSTTVNHSNNDYIAVRNLPGTAHTLMYFDVAKAQLPADAVVVDAILTLYPYDNSNNSNFMCHFNIYPMSAEWNETTCTWTRADGVSALWANVGGDYSATTRIGEFSIIPITAFNEALPIQAHLSPAYVQNWKNGHANYGFIIKHDDESEIAGVNKNLFMHSRKATDASLRPSLRIIYARTSQMAADMSVEGIRAEYQTSLQSK